MFSLMVFSWLGALLGDSSYFHENSSAYSYSEKLYIQTTILDVLPDSLVCNRYR